MRGDSDAHRLTINPAGGSSNARGSRSAALYDPVSTPVTFVVMLKFTYPWQRLLSIALTACALLACTPAHDWREVRGANAPFTVMLPAKPAVQTRQLELAGMQVTMTMTAAVADEVTFGVASVQLPNPAGVMPALEAMKNALVSNIDGSIRKQTQAPSSYGPGPAFDIDALGLFGLCFGGLLFFFFVCFVVW